MGNQEVKVVKTYVKLRAKLIIVKFITIFDELFTSRLYKLCTADVQMNLC